jgi:hypothetical protein
MFLFFSESCVFSLVSIRTSAILGHVPITGLVPIMGVVPMMGHVPINVNALGIGHCLMKLHVITINVLLMRRRIYSNLKLSHKCFLMVHIHSYLLTQIVNHDYLDITRVADACPAVHHTRVCLAAHHWFYAKIVTTQ